MNTAHLLLGANLGDPVQQIHAAVALIAEFLGEVITQSALYRSSAWGVSDQPDFYNQVLILHTAHSAEETLTICQSIENKLGRVRLQKWGARVMDIDILYFNNETIRSQHLQVPHPYLHLRRFTLLPLCEVAPQYIHPVMGISNFDLLEQCPDTLPVIKM